MSAKESSMDKISSVQVIQEAFAAFGRGDIPTILETLTEDVDWWAGGPPELPHAGQWHGRDEVAQFFVAIDEHWVYEKFEPQEFIAQSDQVAVTGHDRVRAKSTGKVVEQDWAMFFNLRDGRIARFRIFTDTATLVSALVYG
jgi:ketosteroid isomerase-like protein